MTFEEYQLALQKPQYRVVYNSDLHRITVLDCDNIKLLEFDSMANNECILDYSIKIGRLNEMTYLFNQTNKFLSTPYEKRKLEPIYQLVWDINSRGQWVLGYDNELWEIGKADALEKQGYQVNFTNDELDSLTCNNPDLASRLEALKRRVNYK